MLFICYPKCSTCIKAKQFLTSHNIDFIERDIKLDNPSKEELLSWINKYNIPVKKLLNTSGILYRELELSKKIPNMTLEEVADILSTNGMLVKRPILIDDKFILTGFKEKEWTENLC